ncbi:MAG: hypothetical protein COC17_02800 [Hyphomicrobiales bacterium]|nr:MAG: hypothetical protein COC17_02800 [Hyphomicrobiales bacterium]
MQKIIFLPNGERIRPDGLTGASIKTVTHVKDWGGAVFWTQICVMREETAQPLGKKLNSTDCTRQTKVSSRQRKAERWRFGSCRLKGILAEIIHVIEEDYCFKDEFEFLAIYSDPVASHLQARGPYENSQVWLVKN